MTRDWLLIPNLLSLGRLLAAPFLSLCLAGPVLPFVPLALLAAFVIASDFLDGILARRLGQTSRLGLLLDPLADKADLFAASLALLLSGRLSPLLFAILLGKDLLIMAGGAILVRRTRVVPASNAIGKWTTVFLSFGIAILVAAEAAGDWLPLLAAGRGVLAGGLVLALLSLGGYGLAMARALGATGSRTLTTAVHALCLAAGGFLAGLLLTTSQTRWL